jgi:hypothetical protein
MEHDVRRTLKGADLPPSDLSIRPADAARIQQRMRAAASEPESTRSRAAAPVAVAAVAVAVAASLYTFRLSPPQRAVEPSPAADVAVVMPHVQAEQRQLHFFAPSGTRLIWIVNP